MLQSKLTLLVLIGAFIMAYAEELGSDRCKCSYGPWTQSQCSVACGSGIATKTRNCVCPADHRGRPDCKGQPTETVTVSCNAGPCCCWGLPWSNWTNCTDGYMTRNQTCTCVPGAPAGSTCSGPAPIERMPCCSWGNYTNFTDCNVNCGGGNQTRYRPCICGTYDLKPVDKKKCYEDRRPPTPNPNIPNYCVGPSVETQVCNNFSCCTWGNFSEWSNCSSNLTCGGNQTRYATCNCTYPYNTSLPLTCPAYFNQTMMNVTALNISLFCEGPQPMETQFCPNCTNCTFSVWSNWTQCDQSCNGTQYRRQLCTCPGNATCSASYNDSLCVGVPLNETRTCNVSCCNWNFTENWSTCIADNNCCGNGTQWRRPVCTCDGVLSPDSNCTYAGVPPLNQTRVCNVSCCQLGPLTRINCSQLLTNQPGASDYCVTPWSESTCFCPDASGNLTVPSNYTQCILNPTTPPISFNFSADNCGNPATNVDSLIICNEFSNNSTCVAWNITVNLTTGAVIQIFDPVSTANSTCSYNTAANCWDSWTEWSPCCGPCNNGTQWRRQISSNQTLCRTPPAYETRACNVSCCQWIYVNTTAFSNCSALCGSGTQWRFPYNCSCGNDSLCPIPPPLEVQNCTVPCCTWVNSTDMTQCDLNNCSLPNFRWNTQKCLCNTTNSTTGLTGIASACGISDCLGVPITNLTACPNCTTTNSTCEWRIVSTSNCTGNCSKIVIVDAPYPGKEKDCKKDKWGKPVVQNATIIPVNGTQIITRACFCGNRQVAPGNCSSNFTTFTVLPCSLNCTCAWVNLTSWSACTCGKRYYTRMCNCSEIVCNSTTPRKSPPRSRHHDDDDRHWKRHVSGGGRNGDRDDDDDGKCTLPEPAYSYACGGYDIVFEECSKPTYKKSWQVAEDIASTTVSNTHTSEETSNNLLTIIIPTIIIAVIITAAVVLVLMKNRNI